MDTHLNYGLVCVYGYPPINLYCFILIMNTHFIGSSNHGRALYFFIWILDRHSSEWSTLVSSEFWMPAPFFPSVMKPLARWKWVCAVCAIDCENKEHFVFIIMENMIANWSSEAWTVDRFGFWHPWEGLLFVRANWSREGQIWTVVRAWKWIRAVWLQ